MWFLIGLVAAGLYTLTVGGILADQQSIGDADFAQKAYRGDLSFAVGISLIPIAWLITPFMTGFYEHGFQYRRRK